MGGGGDDGGGADGGGGGVTVDGINVDDGFLMVLLVVVFYDVISSVDVDDGVLNNGRAGWLRWTPISANISSLLSS